MKLRALLPALVCVAISALAQDNVIMPAEVYQTPGPHVVVNGVLLKAPVREVGGSLLLPMRAVFEALEAEVRWFPAAQQIIATRGSTTVQLWIGRSVAIVNDREIRLAAPPTLAAGTTYVPLRFPAEAFGGDVKWLGSIRTASITIAALQAPTMPITEPVRPAVEEPAALEGVIVTKVTSGVTALVVQHAKGDTTLVQMGPTVSITRANADQAPRAVAFAALELGDLVRITRDAAGKATSVAARFAQVKGVAAAIANNRLLLEDGSLYQLQPDIRVVADDGQAVPLARIGKGSPVTLDLTPDTTNVWRVTVPAQAAQTTPAQSDLEPGILTVAAVGYTKPLKAGETVTLQVTGEPNAERVTASIGDVLRDLALTQVSPGAYTRKVTVAANTNVTAAPIVATMRLNGKDTAPVKSVVPITIDTRPPSFNALIPGDGTRLLDRNPTIEAAYSDPGGSGVDVNAVKVVVNGRDVTRLATITDSRVRYKAQSLALGTVTIRISISDLAGNVAAADWKVTVAEAPATTQQYVKHDAVQPLMAGQKLNLAGKFAVTPTKLEWYLGNKLISSAMARDAASGEYRVAYTVEPTVALGEHSVSVRVYTSAGQSQVLFATTTVTLVAQPRAFGITSPADKSKAPSPLIVTGQATPGMQVRVVAEYAGRVAFVPIKGELYRAVLEADVRGVWETEPIDTNVLLIRPDTYTVTAELLDAAGKVANTATITLTRR